jgi:molybdenum cofactor cytidylyltransferase
LIWAVSISRRAICGNPNRNSNRRPLQWHTLPQGFFFSMIAALVLAAGRSRRMGTNKMLLPFGERTVLAHVVAALQACPLRKIVVVTGHERSKIEALFGDTQPALRFAHNPGYASGDMLSSVQTGLAALYDDPRCEAALVALGDQPRIEQHVVEQVMAAHLPGVVVIPSFRRRGGHPILIDRMRWSDILALPPGATLRDAWRARPDWVRYINVDTDTILSDMDTPEDYRRVIEKRQEPHDGR